MRTVLSSLHLSLLVCWTLFLISCEKEEPEPQLPSISAFSPNMGLPGTIVTISGQHFSSTATENAVTFSGVNATVTEGSKTSLKVIVPEGATTGLIEVTVGGETAISATEFVVPPVITEFAPTSGATGTEVVITGTGFSATPGSNNVTVGGVAAIVKAATATSLTIEVPLEASTGEIEVTLGDASATSAEDFIVLPVISQIIPPQGAVNRLITIQGSGFSETVDENLLTMNGVPMTILSATVNELTFKVPEAAAPGAVEVVVGGNSFAGPSFEVVVEAVAAGGPNYDSGYAIAVDGDGNVYVAGSFLETITFGSTTLQSADGEDIFVAKYNAQSEVLWAIRAGGDFADRASQILVDHAGNVFIAGSISSTASFGPQMFTSAGASDVFVAEINSSGDFKWVKTFGGNGTDGIYSIIEDHEGNLVIAGSFETTISFGSTSFTSEGETDSYVAKLTPASGEAIWATRFGGLTSSYSHALGAGSGGDLFVAGSFFGTASFGPHTFTAPQDVLNSFVLKLNAAGEVAWAKQIEGTGWNNTVGIAVGPDGNCVATGYFSNTTTFGSVTANPVSLEDIFVAKYASSDGNVLWVETAGGTDFDKAEAIISNDAGDLYLTGYIARTGSFGDQTFNTNGNSQDIFVSKYDTNGNFQWLRTAGGSDFDGAFSIVLGPTGIVHVTGFFRDAPGLFEVTELANAGGDDVFVWKIWP